MRSKRANRAFEEAYQRFVARIDDEKQVKASLVAIEAAATDALAQMDEDARAGRLNSTASNLSIAR